MANINFLENEVIEFKKTTGELKEGIILFGKEGSMPRNPLIANTLYLSKDIEKWGSGFKRIAEECKKANVKVKFEIKKNGFTVIFYRKNDEELFGLTQNNSKNVALNEKNVALNEKNVALNVELKIKEKYPKLRKVYIDIIKIILENKDITQEEIAYKLNKTRNSIYRNTKTLRDMGILDRLGSKKNGYWKVNI